MRVDLDPWWAPIIGSARITAVLVILAACAGVALAVFVTHFMIG